MGRREGGIGENRLWPVFVLGLTASGSSGDAARPKTLARFVEHGFSPHPLFRH